MALVNSKERISTFWDTKTTLEYYVDLWRTAGRDGERAGIFTINKYVWEEIRDDVEAWVRKEWGRWQAEKPEWFTADVLERIPKEWLLVEDVVVILKEKQKKEEGSRKNSSVAPLSMDDVKLLEDSTGGRDGGGWGTKAWG